MSSERKCQDGCPHPQEAHVDGSITVSAHCTACFEEAKDRFGEVGMLQKIFHPFETLSSLRAEVEALTEAHASEMALASRCADAANTYGGHYPSCTGKMRETSDCCDCGWSDTQIEIDGVRQRETPPDAEKHLAIQQSLEQQVAALTAERDEARAVERAIRNDLHRLHKELGSAGSALADANDTINSLSGQRTTLAIECDALRQFELTDESCAGVAVRLADEMDVAFAKFYTAALSPISRVHISDIISAARGMKEKA